MARPRINDPLGVSDHPVVVTELVREAKVVAEYERRRAYALDSFRKVRRAYGPLNSFNESLRHLRRTLDGKSVGGEGYRLHPEISLLLHHLASRRATDNGRGGVPTDEDLTAATRDVVEQLKTGRRPEDRVLRHHVEGLMALVQEVCGRPVLATLTKGDTYDPQATNAPGKMVIELVRHIDPSVSVRSIVRIILDARRKYAGKRMRFIDFFPTYGAALSTDGQSFSGGPGRPVHVESWSPTLLLS